MDRIEPDREAGQADGAEQAFEALREEVAALRRGVELVYRQVQASPVADAPDYSPTLGQMQKALENVAARLEAIERQPALQMTGASLRGEIDAGARSATHIISGSLAGAVNEMRSANNQMEGLFRQVRGRREQQARLWMAGVCGVLGGAFLWFFLAALLPWGAGDWLASLPIAGGGPWAAGQALLQRDSAQSWDKMVRLYDACGEQTTQFCEAAIAVGRASPPAASTAPEGAKVPSFGTVPGAARGRSGQGR